MTSDTSKEGKLENLCFWIGVAIYALLVYLLYRVLELYPSFHQENADVIYAVAWLPIGIVAWGIKSKIEDWLNE